MKKMVCSVCTYTYDEAVGIPDAGIAPGTKWEDLPEDWKCPWCGAGKDAFRQQQPEGEAVLPQQLEKPHVDRELSALEMSIICSNLARGCEKQYLPKESEAFQKLAAFFKGKAEPVKDAGVADVLELLNKELQVGYPYANSVSAEKPDRGALRCLVWSEKVTNMLKSILERYQVEGDKMLENTGIYVCTICGFLYVGDEAPELCPVCKVPSWKFEKVERRA